MAMDTNLCRDQRIRDPVHGLITFYLATDRTDFLAWRLLASPAMQRLRRIRQLGFAEIVYPGAAHSRFAHGVGAYHMARRLLAVIRYRLNAQKKVFDERRAQVAALATLLHDVGHGPLSHLFENALQGYPAWRSHEQWGAQIILCPEAGIIDILGQDIAYEVAQMVSPDSSRPPEDIYAALVASQFDADRLDYIIRDRMMTGIGIGSLDLDWLLDSLEVVDKAIVPSYQSHAKQYIQALALNHKGHSVGEDYVRARFELYRRVYYHKTARAAEVMLQNILRWTLDNLLNGHAGPNHPFSVALGYWVGGKLDISSYLDLDDPSLLSWLSVLRRERASHWCGPAELAARLMDRQLYRCLDFSGDRQAWERLKISLGERFPPTRSGPPAILFDEFIIHAYERGPWPDDHPLNLVLLCDQQGYAHDIASRSALVQALGQCCFYRVYTRDEAVHRQAVELVSPPSLDSLG